MTINSDSNNKNRNYFQIFGHPDDEGNCFFWQGRDGHYVGNENKALQQNLWVDHRAMAIPAQA